MFINLDYTLEPDEYARGVIAAFRRYRTLVLVWSVAMALFAVADVLSIAGHTSPPDWPWAAGEAGAALYGFSWLWLQRRRLKQQYKKAKIKSLSIVFAEDGVAWTTVTENGESRGSDKWRTYIKIRETPDFFLLYPNKKRATVIPKRAFSLEQAELFSRFVAYEFEKARLAPTEDSAQLA